MGNDLISGNFRLTEAFVTFQSGRAFLTAMILQYLARIIRPKVRRRERTSFKRLSDKNISIHICDISLLRPGGLLQISSRVHAGVHLGVLVWSALVFSVLTSLCNFGFRRSDGRMPGIGSEIRSTHTLWSNDKYVLWSRVHHSFNHHAADSLVFLIFLHFFSTQARTK